MCLTPLRACLQAFCTLLQAAFAVYDEAELRDRQKKALDVVTSVLSIDASDAARVLRECKW